MQTKVFKNGGGGPVLLLLRLAFVFVAAFVVLHVFMLQTTELPTVLDKVQMHGSRAADGMAEPEVAIAAEDREQELLQRENALRSEIRREEEMRLKVLREQNAIQTQQLLRQQERARELERKQDQELLAEEERVKEQHRLSQLERELPAIDPKYNETCVKLGRGHLEGDFAVEGACFSRRRVQRIITDIVLDTSKVFNRHNITHFLDSGTLLGQFRSQTMIPFDQDADMGIDEMGFKIIQSTPIQFPDKYAFHVFDSRHHPRGSRFIELPARVIHRESALYVDIFVYIDSYNATAGGDVTGPIPSGCFINCRRCPKTAPGRWQFQVPYDWIYPLQDCQFAGHTLKCPAERMKYLDYMFGEDYMTPRVFPY